jgi:S1-C subfamily serine protease
VFDVVPAGRPIRPSRPAYQTSRFCGKMSGVLNMMKFGLGVVAVKPALRFLVWVIVLSIAGHAWAGAKEDFVAGRAALQGGNYHQAVELFTKVVNRPDLNLKGKALALFFRGASWTYLKQYANAIQDFDLAVKLRPDWADAFYERGLAWGMLKKHDLAYRDINRAIRLNPKKGLYYHGRGLALFKQGQSEMAREDFSRAIRLSPKDYRAYYNRGLVWKKEGNDKRALADFSKALQLEPKFLGPRKHRYQLYKKRGQTKKAMDDCKIVLKLRPHDNQAFIDLQALKKAYAKSQKKKAVKKRKPKPRPKRLAKADKPVNYERMLNAVVIVKSSLGTGSGFFINEKGLIVTNHHVVENDKTVEILTRGEKTLKGYVLENREDWDLALVAVNTESPHWLGLTRKGTYGVGDEVFAVGTPMGLSWTLSRGIVSAMRKFRGAQVVQTDAAINTGNSGGPLILKKNGKVVGVNTFVYRKDLAEGLNFAMSHQMVAKAFSDYLPKKKQRSASVKKVGYTGATPAIAPAKPYSGNVNNRVFHKPVCRYYACASCQASFATRQMAIQAGYRPCGVCKP